MYLVVRLRTTRPFAELAAAAALATRRCAHRYRDDDRWRDGFEDWWQHSRRKVCLRAEPRQWEVARALDHERVGDVACLPPVHRSRRERVLARMQALGDLPGELPEPGEHAPGALTFVVNTGLGMSAGKTLAQLGPAALVAGHDAETELRVAGASGARWAELAPSATAVVRDGGLTEIAAGSETVLVFWREPHPEERIESWRAS